MFKKTIVYTDFNGVERTQDFYFHLSKSELMAMAADGNAMMDRVKKIVDAKDGRAILEEFRSLIALSAGVRSDDGTRFIKNEEAKSTLMDSPAFDELLMDLATNADAASEFVRQLIPEKMQKEMQAQLLNKQQDGVSDPFPNPTESDPRPAWMKEGRNPTDEELRNMTKEELQAAFRHRL